MEGTRHNPKSLIFPVASYLFIAPSSNPVETSNNGGSKPSAGEIAGIVFASVVAAGILLALAKCFTSRRRRHQNGNTSPVKRPKIWRKSVLSSGFVWKRHRRTTSSESSPIIEAVWNSKPLTSMSHTFPSFYSDPQYLGASELPIHNTQTTPGNQPAATLHPNSNQRKSVVPVITVTSPSTISTVPSLYSSTHQDLPGRSPFKLSIYETDRGVRQSDPYASYAAAYAAFAGMTQPDDDEDDRTTNHSHQKRRQQSALRDSSLLPTTNQIQDRILQVGTNQPRNPPPPPLPRAAPPSAFKGQGIRDGKKGTRTLSDKIKRGTLPLPPQLGEGVLHVSGNLTVVDTDAPENEPVEREYTVEGDLTVVARSNEPEEPKDQRPSLIPTFSSGSSSKSGTPPNATPKSSLGKAQELPTVITSSQPTDPAFWTSYGDLSVFETTEGLEHNTDASSDSAHDDVEKDDADARRQSLRAGSPSSSKATAHRSTRSDGGSLKRQKRPFNSTLSIMTLDTSHSHTNRSSIFSLTPSVSVSEFPMPPFKSSTGTPSTRLSTSTSEATTSTNAITDLVASTPSSSSGSGPRNHIVREKAPPSAFATAIQGRPRRSKAPSLRILRNGPSAVIKSAQTGSGSGMSPSTQIRAPVRRNSSRSSRNSRRRSGSRSYHMSLGGDELAPPLPNTNGSPESFYRRGAGGFRGITAEDLADVPLYLRKLPETPKDGRDTALSFNTELDRSRNPSRLTMASAMTTTDEEFSGDVQVFVASRRSMLPDLPRAIAPSTAMNSTPSLHSDAVGSRGSSNGRWEMIIPNDKPVAQAQSIPTGLSISTDRSQYRAVNVPVSARTDMFEVGASEMSHANGPRQELTYGLGSGMGMPWSPNFDWPASPAFNINVPPSSVPQSAPITSQPSRSFKADSSKGNDYPTSISGSTNEGWDVSQYYSESRPLSQGTMASGESPGWKEIVAVVPGAPKRSASRVRDSSYSTTSTFFGGVRTSTDPSFVIPPVPPMPPPAPAAIRDSWRPSSSINTQPGWRARPSTSQYPVDKPRPQRQRQTAQTAVGGVNSVFATPQSPSVAKPKLTLQRVEAYRSSIGNLTPTSRYYSPYTAHTSPPSSAELLISKR